MLTCTMNTIFVVIVVTVSIYQPALSANSTVRYEANDNIKQFEEKVSKTLGLITNYTNELFESAELKSIKNVENQLNNIFKDADEIIKKFQKVKTKNDNDLKECSDRFLGESSVLWHLLELSAEIDFAIKEVHQCPKDMGGIECLINALVRGEALCNEADGIIKAETGTASERVANLLNWIGKCNTKSIENVRAAMKNFMDEIKKCE